MSRAPVAKWIALALVGLAVAIGVAVAATGLTSQQIGIASESVSAGDALAPGLRSHPPERTRRHRARDERQAIAPEPPVTEAAPPPGEEAEPPRGSGGEETGGDSDDD